MDILIIPHNIVGINFFSKNVHNMLYFWRLQSRVHAQVFLLMDIWDKRRKTKEKHGASNAEEYKESG